MSQAISGLTSEGKQEADSPIIGYKDKLVDTGAHSRFAEKIRNFFRPLTIKKQVSITTMSDFTNPHGNQAEESSQHFPVETIPQIFPDRTRTGITPTGGKAPLKYGPKQSPYKNPRVAVAAVVMRQTTDKKHELLLTQRWVNPEKGTWELPGGFIGHDDPKKEVIRILKETTNLDANSAHFVTLLNSSDGRDHVVTFTFLVLLDSKSFMPKNVEKEVMQSDGTRATETVMRYPIDERKPPSWMWWYEVSQLPNWMTAQERKVFETENPEAKYYDLVQIAFSHHAVFPVIRKWMEKYNKTKVVYGPMDSIQPLNEGNTALTADALVVKKDTAGKYHLALIKRGADPFKGCMATAGGFINYNETPAKGATRELWEETNLTAEESKAYLMGYRGSRERDPRQHTITCIYVIKAEPNSLAGFKAGDDASGAEWLAFEKAFGMKDYSGKKEPGNKDKNVDSKATSELAFDHRLILEDFQTWWNEEGVIKQWCSDEKDVTPVGSKTSKSTEMN